MPEIFGGRGSYSGQDYHSCLERASRAEAAAGRPAEIFHLFPLAFHDGLDDALDDAVASFHRDRRIGEVIERGGVLVIVSGKVLVADPDAVREHQAAFLERTPSGQEEHMCFWRLDADVQGRVGDALGRNDNHCSTCEVKSHCALGLVGGKRYGLVDASDADLHMLCLLEKVRTYFRNNPTDD